MDISIRIALSRERGKNFLPRINMSVEDAKKIVSETLAAHGDEIELRDLLNAIPEPQRSLLARMFSELRRKGEIKTQLEVNTATGEKSHRVRLSGEFAPKFPPDSSGGDA